MRVSADTSYGQSQNPESGCSGLFARSDSEFQGVDFLLPGNADSEALTLRILGAKAGRNGPRGAEPPAKLKEQGDVPECTSGDRLRGGASPWGLRGERRSRKRLGPHLRGALNLTQRVLEEACVRQVRFGKRLPPVLHGP